MDFDLIICFIRGRKSMYKANREDQYQHRQEVLAGSHPITACSFGGM